MGFRAVLLILRGLGNARDPAAGAQAPVARLEGLEVPNRQTPQECVVCYGPKGSAEHEDP